MTSTKARNDSDPMDLPWLQRLLSNCPGWNAIGTVNPRTLSLAVPQHPDSLASAHLGAAMSAEYPLPGQRCSATRTELSLLDCAHCRLGIAENAVILAGIGPLEK